MNKRKRPLPGIHALYEEAEYYFRYDPERGELFWARPRQRAKTGERAGCYPKNGRPTIRVLGHRFQLSQIVWLLNHFSLPVLDGLQIDHIDRNPANNRLDNLRLARPVDNLANKATALNPDIGIYELRSGRFRAQIMRRKRRISLGTFATREEARAAYVAASRAIRREFSPI